MKSLSIGFILLISTNVFSKTYVIPKGKHSSKGLHAAPFRNDNLYIRAKFSNSAIYQTQKTENQGDINKLFGFSDCWSAHHKNSARFGWRYYENNLELFAYTYSDKQRGMLKIGNMELNVWHEMKLDIVKNKYVFSFKDQRIELPRGCKSKRANGFKLYPYFGGDETAPHEIKIEIDRE